MALLAGCMAHNVGLRDAGGSGARCATCATMTFNASTCVWVIDASSHASTRGWILALALAVELSGTTLAELKKG